MKTKIIKTPLLFIHSKVTLYVIVTATFLYFGFPSTLIVCTHNTVFYSWFVTFTKRPLLLDLPFGLQFILLIAKRKENFFILFLRPRSCCDIRRKVCFWIPYQNGVVKYWCWFTHVLFISCSLLFSTYHVTQVPGQKSLFAYALSML